MRRAILSSLMSCIFVMLTFHSVYAITRSHSYSVIFGDWTIENEHGRKIGYVNFMEVSVDASGGTGSLFRQAGFFSSTTIIDVSVRRLGREAYDFDVRFQSANSGEQADGRLLISLKWGDGDPDRLIGSIEHNNSFKLITLVRNKELPIDSNDEINTHDLPGIGVTGPSYRTRNLPKGSELLIRATPDHTSRIISQLDSFAVELLVLSCSPQIESQRFHNANLKEKRILLDGAWCKVEVTEPPYETGFVPGQYLDPVLER